MRCVRSVCFSFTTVLARNYADRWDALILSCCAPFISPVRVPSDLPSVSRPATDERNLPSPPISPPLPFSRPVPRLMNAEFPSHPISSPLPFHSSKIRKWDGAQMGDKRAATFEPRFDLLLVSLHARVFLVVENIYFIKFHIT